MTVRCRLGNVTVFIHATITIKQPGAMSVCLGLCDWPLYVCPPGCPTVWCLSFNLDTNFLWPCFVSGCSQVLQPLSQHWIVIWSARQGQHHSVSWQRLVRLRVSLNQECNLICVVPYFQGRSCKCYCGSRSWRWATWPGHCTVLSSEAGGGLVASCWWHEKQRVRFLVPFLLKCCRVVFCFL